jgi:uncharacterized protein
LITLLLFIVFSLQNSGIGGIHSLLARAAQDQVGVTIIYAPEYVRLSYPEGDVPSDRGVCTDVVIRAFRKIDIDLQKELHEDMSSHFAKYPKIWNLKKPDSNIDHRRVPNLMKYFSRKGKSISLDDDYQPGDIVAWLLPSGSYHIGIVSDEMVPEQKHYFIIHNIGEGAKKEDVLWSYKIIGHYRW